MKIKKKSLALGLFIMAYLHDDFTVIMDKNIKVMISGMESLQDEINKLKDELNDLKKEGEPEKKKEEE